MAQISFKPNRAYPSIPTIGQDQESHSRALEAMRESLAIHERRTPNVLDSFVRVSELVTLGLISLDGTVVEDVASEESTTHHHDSLYIRLDGTSAATTGSVEFGDDITIAGNITVSGTVDGRDIATDGSTLDAHVALVEEHIDWTVTGVDDIHDDRIAESSVTQHEAAIDHDALLNFVAAEHIDWSVTGAEDINVDRISEAAVTQHEAALTIIEGQITGANFSDWDTAFGWGDHAAAGYADDSLVVHLAGIETITGAKTFTALTDFSGSGTTGIRVRDGGYLRILDTGDTDYANFTHNGTNFAVSFVNTTAFQILDGVRLDVYDSTNADRITLLHDGTDGFLLATNAIDINYGSSTLTRHRFETATSGGIFDIVGGQTLRLWDSSGSDNVAFDHDGTDFNVAGTNTTDINITGISGFNVVNYNFDVDQTVGAGQDNYVLTYDNSTGLISLEAASGGGGLDGTAAETITGAWTFSGQNIDFEDGGWLRIFDATNVDYVEFDHDGTNFNIRGVNTTYLDIESMALRITGGNDLIVGDSTGADSAAFSHNGTHFVSTFTGTAQWDVIGLTSGIQVRDGAFVRVFDSTDTDYVTMQHGGTDFRFTAVNTEDMEFTGFSGYMDLLAGMGLRIRDSSNSDYMFMDHDGTDFNTNFVNTTEWNISNLRIRHAGTMTSTNNANVDGPNFEVVTTTKTVGEFAYKIDRNGDDFGLFVDGNAFVKELRLYDSGYTDYANFAHDGTDFNTTFNATTEWNISGISLVDVSAELRLSGDLRTTTQYLDVRNGLSGATGIRLLNSSAAQQGYLYADGSGTFGLLHSTGGWAVQITAAGAGINLYGTTINMTPGGNINCNPSGHFQVTGGTELRIFDSGSTDYVRMYHDGTDFNATFVNTTDWNIGTNIILTGNLTVDGNVTAWDNASDYVQMWHDGVDANIAVTGGSDLYISGSTGIRVYDSVTATGRTSKAQIADHGSSMHDIGFNTLPKFNFNASDTLEARHCGHITGKTNTTAYTLTGPTSADLDFPVEGVTHVWNLGSSGNYTISDTATCTMYYCDGTSAPVDIVGSGTLAPGGMITLWRESATAIYITGSGFTP